MLSAIDCAKSRVLMEMYLMETGQVADQFIDAFVRAARRGIVVHLFLDGFGSRSLSKSDRARLIDSGVGITFYNPIRRTVLLRKFKRNLRRNHRKFLIVDSHTVFVGGAGVTDDFAGPDAWHDCMVRISGPCAGDWEDLFYEDIRLWNGQVIAQVVKRTEISRGKPGRLIQTSGGVQLPIKRILLNRVRNGQHRIWLSSAYFIPSAKIRRALRRKAAQGIDVRLLLPGTVTDHPAVRQASRRYYAGLIRHGVRIFEFQKKFVHSKAVLIDNWCTIGSSNLDRWNFRWNLEANQEMDDPVLAEKLANMLRNDFSKSLEVDPGRWLRRSRFQRLSEWVWGQIDRWLTGLNPGDKS
jgi:phosphatidylserine/phosphatidylglycerophosphate/cardiolipin synthase-like enzyme